jgi:3-hydroxyacyl-[acyl-carrier-protein] dehydratase
LEALDIAGILQQLPHRYPFLLIDRVLELEPGKRIVALKNVSINEPHFQGHFPGTPVMPGVLVIEAMAQAAAVLSFRTLDSRPDGKRIIYFAGIDGARFKRPVVPGDQLRLEVTLVRIVRGVGKFTARALVGEALAAEAEIIAALRDAGPPG